MIRLEKIGKSFGARALFEQVDWHIRPGDKVGLVGDNGTGKTTLLRILAGHIEPESGGRLPRKGLRIGYLGQEIIAENTGGALLDTALRGRGDLLEAERRMERIAADIETAGDDGVLAEKLAGRLSEAHENFRSGGGFRLAADARAVLRGLGFSEDDFGKPLGVFSGGWRMRAELARILLSEPDILLLDEPTNHLDLESTVWLEKFIKGFAGSLVIISHDRYFLNRMVGAIAELDRGRLTLYPYPYDRYVEEKNRRAEALEKKAAHQKKELEKQERFIERFRAKNTKATQVQSRIKALEKIERIETGPRAAFVGLRFREAGRIGKDAVTLEAITQGYGGKKVYRGLDFRLYRGDRVALVGPNGAGKSTLLKIIAGRVPIQSGDISFGNNVAMRYFAQSQSGALDADRTALGEVTRSIPNEAIPMARATLGALLFHGDDVDKRIKVLSGGEKSRVALAITALNPTNLLLLDEPTNHLDLKSRQTLERSLRAYAGCLLMISHDRAFIDAVANKVAHVENGTLTMYPGNYAYYERKREQERAAAPPDNGNGAGAKTGSKKEARREAARRREDLGREIAPLRERLEAVESQIAVLERELSRFEAVLADPATFADREKSREASRGAAEARRRNEELMREWETLSEKIEAISLSVQTKI